MQEIKFVKLQISRATFLRIILQTRKSGKSYLQRILKMEAIYSFETSVSIDQSTWRHISGILPHKHILWAKYEGLEFSE
jgi:hypothetical protein